MAVFHTVMGATGTETVEGTLTKRGTALADHCERVGPLSLDSGFGWWWSCDATVTWPDGSTQEQPFKFSELTPENYTTPEPVVLREKDNRGDNIVLDETAEYAELGWALLIPLIFLFIVGVQVPGLPRGYPDREQRRRERLHVWPPAVLAAGWWLVIAGGLGHGHLTTLTFLPMIAIVIGHGVLAAGASMAVTRRQNQYPDREVPTSVGNRARRANALLILGTLGLLAALSTDETARGTLALTAFPLIALGFGLRGHLVSTRIRRLNQA
ncbi:hypothetical protein IQ251_03090 [Saccharopolyspora sp. HNM0983]|uniref:Uncharacterized protein n=1 Tax=Saccharopolyspora montiporae TaxID=2781240 RepID=A0A929B716_9PSEU|nr:hypothetical protein [Saccharopolyspora sp. HNM0983]